MTVSYLIQPWEPGVLLVVAWLCLVDGDGLVLFMVGPWSVGNDVGSAVSEH